MASPDSVSSRLNAMVSQEDSSVHKRKGEASNKENQANDYRDTSIDHRKKRRSSDNYDNSNYRTKDGRERRPSETNIKRIETTPDSSKSESSLDHDTPQTIYKSASERITDEYASTSSPIVHNREILDQNTSSEEIIWPSWLGGSMMPPPPRELEDISRRQKQRRLKMEESPLRDQHSIGSTQPSPSMKLEIKKHIDLAPDIDVSNMRTAKAVLSGDGWRVMNGKRVAIVSAKFRSSSELPIDPRSGTYSKELDNRLSMLVLDNVAL